jgi:tRNA uridine 5-carbamoylmethylation protein Kti12
LGKQLREERDRLNAELAKIADDSDAKIMEERLRLEKLAEVQISNYIKAGENKAEMLEAEIRKLTELLEMKSKSIQDMNKTADLYREQSNEQFAAL